jgi:hypothetical protein
LGEWCLTLLSGCPRRAVSAGSPRGRSRPAVAAVTSYQDATQTMFGGGLRRASLVLIGAQPGDVEGQAGRTPARSPLSRRCCADRTATRDWAEPRAPGSRAATQRRRYRCPRAHTDRSFASARRHGGGRAQSGPLVLAGPREDMRDNGPHRRLARAGTTALLVVLAVRGLGRRTRP